MSRQHRSRGVRRWSGACAAAIVVALAWTGAASAAVVVGSGCTLPQAVAAANAKADSGGCTGVAPSGQTTISVPTGSYALTGGELKIVSGASVKLVGDGETSTIIDGGGVTRDFEVVQGGALALESLKVTGGKALDGPNGDTSGACSHIGAGCPGGDGGGILNAGALTLNHVTVIGNSAGHGGMGNSGDTSSNPTFHSGQDGNRGGSGGGIFSTGNLIVTASTITNDHTGAGGNGGSGGAGGGSTAYGGGAGIGGSGGAGGGIYNGGSATISDTTISGNTTGRGGNGGDGGNGSGQSGNLGGGGSGGRGGNNGWLNDDVHALPSFLGGGGGIASSGPLTVTGSTISGNGTGAGGNGGGAGNSYAGGATGGTGGGGGWGGGVAILGDDPNASFTNTTIANNLTGDGGHGGGGPSGGSGGPGFGGTGGDGGGLHTVGVPNSGGVAIDHVTIAGNAVGAGGPAYNIIINGRDGTGGGIRTDQHNSPAGGNGISLKNSIVSRNEAPNCVRSVADGGQGDFLDQGGNVQWNVVSAEQANDTSCPGTYGDTQLGTLQNNSGPTLTMLPGGASSAIDAATCDVLTDQRGIARPSSGCDSGSVEAGALPLPAGTSTALGASPSPSTAGQAVTYTATVSPAPNGGTVAFKDGGTVIFNCGSRAVTSGTATCITTYGAAGSHTITAAYTGTSAYANSSATPLTQVVKAKPPTGGGGGTKPPGGGGSTAPKPVAPRNAALPAITGTTTSGRTLTASRGTWTGTAPLAYAYQWQRCAATCAPIGGATGASYTLKTADVGKAIVVVVTASNTAGHSSAASASRGPVVPAASKVKAFLGKLIFPTGKAGKIGALLKAGGYKFSATAPSAGTLTLSWYQVPKGAKAVSAKKKKKAKKPVLVATVKTSVKKAGRVKPKIKLTAKGKKLLKHAKKIKLTAKQTFKPKGGKATVVRKPFRLKR